MKNLKVGKKLTIAFTVIIMLTFAVGIVSVKSLNELNDAYADAIKMHGNPLASIVSGMEMLRETHVELYRAIVNTGNPEELRAIEKNVQEYTARFESIMADYSLTIVREDARELFDNGMGIYADTYKPLLLAVINDAKKGVGQGELLAYAEKENSSIERMTDSFTLMVDTKNEMLSQTTEDVAPLSNNLLIVMIVLLVAAILISVFLGMYISGSVSKPLATITAFMDSASRTGDLAFSPEFVSSIEDYSGTRDEIGHLVTAIDEFIARIGEANDTLEIVMAGDLTLDIRLLSVKDSIGHALKKMVDSLNAVFGEIQSSAGKVSFGADQIAEASQTLAQGATEQAAAIEELSSSMTEIAAITNENKETAEKTAKLAGSIQDMATKGSEQMDELMDAVRQINLASNSISKIIQTIDDIAFQTNILALNATIEAARAGENGKGFAVVAEEVRNLAAKSAEAAKETDAMIQNSMEKAEIGSRITKETAARLAEIVVSVHEGTRLINGISQSLREQTAGITNVNFGVEQISLVIQQNCITANESAAASEEMSTQAGVLKELLLQFKLKGQ